MDVIAHQDVAVEGNGVFVHVPAQNFDKNLFEGIGTEDLNLLGDAAGEEEYEIGLVDVFPLHGREVSGIPIPETCVYSCMCVSRNGFPDTIAGYGFREFQFPKHAFIILRDPRLRRGGLPATAPRPDRDQCS
jgi:hypothetical protein